MTPQSGNRVSTSLSNSGLCWTVFARNRDTAVPVEGNGDLQTLICVFVAKPRRCSTLSNPVLALTKLNGGLSRLHSADEDVVSWLTSYGLWHTYEKKKIESGTIWKLGYGFLFAFHGNYGRIFSHFGDIQRQTMAWLWNLGLGSFKVIEDGVVRQIMYDFLLVRHCNHSSILYHFRVIWRWIISWPWNLG